MLPWSLENRISLKILFTYRDEGVSFGALQITMEFQFRLVHSSAEVLGDSLYLQGARAHGGRGGNLGECRVFLTEKSMGEGLQDGGLRGD